MAMDWASVAVKMRVYLAVARTSLAVQPQEEMVVVRPILALKPREQFVRASVAVKSPGGAVEAQTPVAVEWWAWMMTIWTMLATKLRLQNQMMVAHASAAVKPRVVWTAVAAVPPA